ncbi:MAG: helix-turn-helix domain-containing protein [Oscillospiraceae bacterium]|nr:helix-turn-helix domain-containing protein [Oscillospiraceae bacterium]
MPIYRAEKNKDYTIMSNAHLKDTRLSLKAKGLLSYMLSLPDDWKFSTRGLVAHCREGTDSVRVALKELEAAGYLHRTRIRSGNGSFTEEKWEIHEIPEKNFSGNTAYGRATIGESCRGRPGSGKADTTKY